MGHQIPGGTQTPYPVDGVDISAWITEQRENGVELPVLDGTHIREAALSFPSDPAKGIDNIAQLGLTTNLVKLVINGSGAEVKWALCRRLHEVGLPLTIIHVLQPEPGNRIAKNLGTAASFWIATSLSIRD